MTKGTNKVGFLSKLFKKAGDRLRQIDSERAQLAREEEELVQLQLQHESMVNRRKDFQAKVDRARERIETAKRIVANMDREAADLMLANWDNGFGSNVLGAVQECYVAKSTAEMLVADAPRLEREWQGTLSAMSKEIAEFEKKYDLG